ncbi:hypothetical protein G6O67_003956 [Ophiocordyceps sinensis]|uniref:Uncharacterized protein n=1 Tax=Ophiocordyceps sinensis TaxID=72228 RepID=A0A8H4LXT7_9HYPO|nr:hypothetical protein G6O67_003956 [Ophiocordyceps sinensis]
MTVKALRAVAQGHNGLGAFVLQCKKMDVHYCDWAGSSKGMNNFIKSVLPKFAAANPKSNSPSLHGPASTPSSSDTTSTLELLRDASGEKLKRTNKAVTSTSASVRGIWSPYHGTGMVV